MAYDSRDALAPETLDDILDVPTLPDGHYFGTVVRWEHRDNVGANNRKVDDVVVKLTEPAEDVDPGKLEGFDLSEMEEMTRTFWWTRRGLPELRDFLASFKLPTNNLDMLYVETVGARVMMKVSTAQYTSKRSGKEMTVNNIDEIVGVPANADITDLEA